MNKIIRFLKDPVFRYDILSAHNLLFWKSDEQILKDKYFFRFHKPLNLDNPQTYNEKLQWLKLNDHRPEYVEMVDAGILDPAKVTRSALQNATSVASTLLTTESVVSTIKEDNPVPPMGGQPPMM